MTQFSSWSESESGVTVEIGQARVEEDAGWSAPGRCVIPKVHPPALNRSDQQVPVYWDQTVPVWSSADLDSCKRKPALNNSSSSGSSYGDCCRTVYRRSSPRNPAGDEKVHNGSRTGGNATKVSFDDIMSMYQSSLM